MFYTTMAMPNFGRVWTGKKRRFLRKLQENGQFLRKLRLVYATL